MVAFRNELELVSKADLGSRRSIASGCVDLLTLLSHISELTNIRPYPFSDSVSYWFA